MFGLYGVNVFGVINFADAEHRWARRSCCSR